MAKRKIEVQLTTDIDAATKQFEQIQKQEEQLKKDLDSMRSQVPDAKEYMIRKGLDSKKIEALKKQHQKIETDTAANATEVRAIAEKYASFQYDMEAFVRQIIMQGDKELLAARETLYAKSQELEKARNQLADITRQINSLKAERAKVQAMKPEEYRQYQKDIATAQTRKETDARWMAAYDRAARKRESSTSRGAGGEYWTPSGEHQIKRTPVSTAPKTKQEVKRIKKFQEEQNKKRQEALKSAYDKILEQEQYEWDYVDTILDTSFIDEKNQKHEYKFGGKDSRIQALLANAKKASVTKVRDQAKAGRAVGNSAPGYGAKLGTALHRILEKLPEQSDAALAQLEKSLVDEAVDPETKKIISQITSQKNPLKRQTQIRNLMDWAKNYGNLERSVGAGTAKATEMAVGMTTHFKDTKGNVRRGVIGGAIDRIEDMGNGRLAIVDHKSQKAPVGMDEAFQQILYGIMAKKGGHNIQELMLDWLPYQYTKDNADMRGGMRYRIEGVTPEVEKLVEDIALKGLYAQERAKPGVDTSINIEKALTDAGVRLVPVTSAVVGEGRFLAGPSYTKDQTKDFDYRTSEAFFWKDYGQYLEKWQAGDEEAGKKFQEGLAYLAQIQGKRAGLQSDWFTGENLENLTKAKAGDKAALAALKAAPEIYEAGGTTVNGKYLSQYFKTEDDTKALWNLMETMGKADRERVLNSIFSHKVYGPKGTTYETDDYHQYETIEQNRRAEAFRRQALEAGYYAPSFDDSARIESKNSGSHKLGDASDYTSMAINGHGIGEYISLIRGLRAAGDTTQADEILNKLVGLVQKNLYPEGHDWEGAATDEQYMAQNLASALVTSLERIGIKGGDAYETLRNASMLNLYEDRGGSLARERANEDVPRNVAWERDKATNPELTPENDEKYTPGEARFQRDLHANNSPMEVQAIQAGNRMARLLDLQEKLESEKMFGGITKKVNEARAKAGYDTSLSTEQVIRRYLAQNNPQMYEDYMRSIELNKSIKDKEAAYIAKETQAGRTVSGYTPEQKFEILRGLLDPTSREEGSLFDQIGNLPPEMKNAAVKIFSNRLSGVREENTQGQQFQRQARYSLIGRLAHNEGLGKDEATLNPRIEEQRQKDMERFEVAPAEIERFGASKKTTEEAAIDRKYDWVTQELKKRYGKQYNDQQIDEISNYYWAREQLANQAGGYEELKGLERQEGRITGRTNKRLQRMLDSYAWEFDEKQYKDPDAETERREGLQRAYIGTMTGVDPSRDFDKGLVEAVKTIRGEYRDEIDEAIDSMDSYDSEINRGLDIADEETKKALGAKLSRKMGTDKASKEARKYYELFNEPNPSQESIDEFETQRQQALEYMKREGIDVGKPKATGAVAKAEEEKAKAVEEQTKEIQKSTEAEKKNEAETKDNTAAVEKDTKVTESSTQAEQKSVAAITGQTGVISGAPSLMGGPVTNTVNNSTTRTINIGNAPVSGNVNLNAQTVTMNNNGQTTVINQVGGGRGSGDGGGSLPPDVGDNGGLPNNNNGRGYGGSGGGGGSGEPVDKSQRQIDKENLSEANKLLTQYLSFETQIKGIELEINNIKERRKVGDSEQLKIREKELQISRDELRTQQNIVDAEINNKLNAVSPNAQDSFASNRKTRTDINNRRIAVEARKSGYGESDQLAKEYNRILNERLAIEGKIDQFMLRRDTSMYKREVKALNEAIAAQERKLALVQREGDQLVKNRNLRETDRKAIEAEYRTNRTAQKAQNATGQHGARNVWDLLGMDIKRSMAMIFDFGLAHRAINSVQMKIRELIQTIQELDTAMTNIRIVTGSTRSEAEDLMKTYNSLAKELGVTTQAVAEASNEWLRQGFTVSETQELIEASTYLSTLGMIDAADATQYLTSVLKGFKLEAQDMMDVVSALVKTDQSMAVSAGGIAEALSRSSVSAQLAGMSFEELVGAVSTVGEVTQKSMSSIGESILEYGRLGTLCA